MGVLEGNRMYSVVAVVVVARTRRLLQGLLIMRWGGYANGYESEFK